MSKHELIAKIRTIKELQSLIEEATQEIEALKDELKAHMTEQGTQELNVDIFKLRYTKITSTRFDSAAFKKAHGELYALYSKPSETLRFTIQN